MSKLALAALFEYLCYVSTAITNSLLFPGGVGPGAERVIYSDIKHGE